MLETIGFQVAACEARVRMGRPGINPRTHMLLLVTLDGKTYLSDVGFGGDGLLEPISLDGKEYTQFLWKYRVIQEGPLFVLQSKEQDKWIDLYAFSPDPHPAIDFEVANWYTSTHPESRFVQTLTAQLPTREARYVLRNRIFVIQRGAGAEAIHHVENNEQLLQFLHDYFQLDFPAGTHFRNPLF
jgi:N-hydroxyarylamine O-acetyltransferase